MSAPIHSLHDTLALLASEFGVSWPNPWWPKGIASYNDCAAAMSWALWGLNTSGNPRFTYVSQLEKVFKGDGVWHAGHAGIQAGDCLVFDWNGDGSPDHTELAVGPVVQGKVTSRGTNSSGGDNMHDHTRSAGLVMGYGRPRYPGTSTATTGSPIEQENEMSAHAIVCEEQGATHFAWIALVSENGELHIVDPNNRPWWDDFAAGYSPALTAEPVSEQVYLTWTTANDKSTPAGQAIDLDVLATKTAAKVIASMPSDKPDLQAIEAALAGLPVNIRKELAAHLGS